MPRSHICPSCLTELARTRAVPDPHYELPIVVCPECNLATVRSRHPDIQFWRDFRRVQQAIRTVFAKVLLMLLLAATMVLLVMASGDIYTPFGNLDLLYPFRGGDSLTMAFGIGVVIGGMILMTIVCTVVLHKELYISVLLFLVMAFVLLTSDYSFRWIEIMLANIADFQTSQRLPRRGEFLPRLQRFGLLSVISLLGIIPAIPLRRMVRNTPTRRFRRLLHKRRKQRGSND